MNGKEAKLSSVTVLKVTLLSLFVLPECLLAEVMPVQVFRRNPDQAFYMPQYPVSPAFSFQS